MGEFSTIDHSFKLEPRPNKTHDVVSGSVHLVVKLKKQTKIANKVSTDKPFVYSSSDISPLYDGGDFGFKLFGGAN